MGLYAPMAGTDQTIVHVAQQVNRDVSEHSQ